MAVGRSLPPRAGLDRLLIFVKRGPCGFFRIDADFYLFTRSRTGHCYRFARGLLGEADVEEFAEEMAGAASDERPEKTTDWAQQRSAADRAKKESDEAVNQASGHMPPDGKWGQSHVHLRVKRA